MPQAVHTMMHTQTHKVEQDPRKILKKHLSALRLLQTANRPKNNKQVTEDQHWALEAVKFHVHH